MKLILYVIENYAIINSYTADIENFNEDLTLQVVYSLFKAVKRRQHLRGRAFILMLDNRTFFIGKQKDNYVTYELGVFENDPKSEIGIGGTDGQLLGGDS